MPASLGVIAALADRQSGDSAADMADLRLEE
jgi:hypothetical protein